MQIREGRLRVPKVGWLRLADSDLYAGCRPLTVRIRLEGTESHPKWYAYVCCEVPAEQATDSDGTVYPMPDADKLDAQIAYKQRELNRKQDWGPKDRGKRRSNRGRRVNGQLNKLHRKRDDATQFHYRIELANPGISTTLPGTKKILVLPAGSVLGSRRVLV
ncbi:MAG: hypothetical protein J4G06_11385 [Caldilineaceae bacterium]|nr:hypothetical protein [Caldilineaceae bacterium]